MRTRALFLTLLVVGFISFQRAIAQSQYISVDARVTEADIINATSLVDPMSEKVKDIAPTSFSLTIRNTTSPQTVVWVSMHIEAFVTLDEDGPPAKRIATADTRTPFPVYPPFRIFTSLDAQKGHSKDIDIDSEVDKDMKARLKSKITNSSSGGRAPSGIYQVNIRLTVDSAEGKAVHDVVDLSSDPKFTVTVTNPSNATLLQPSENGFEYPTPFPQFQWTTDVRKIELKVFEKRPEHESLEDAVSASDPFLDVVFEKDKQSGYLPSNFTYPQVPINDPPRTTTKAGPRPLERGKSYVIELDGLRTAFGYDIDPLRTLCLFRVSDPQGQMVLNILQTALSGGAYQNFLNIIQDQKLQITSSRLTLNGVTISGQELQVILNQNKNKISAIRFED